MFDQIAEVILTHLPDEHLPDWYGMTLEQILSAMEEPGVIVMWGCWNNDALATVFSPILT